MKKLLFALLLAMPVAGYSQTVNTDARQKAEEARRTAEEAARKAEEARIAALRAEAAAKEAEAARAKAEAEAAKLAAEEAAKEANIQPAASEMKEEKTEAPANVNKWEKRNSATTTTTTATTADPNAKYLEGAVPEVNGQVEWTLSLSVPGKSAEQIYDELGQLLNDMTKEKGQMEQSRIALAEDDKHAIACRFQEWLVFQNTALSLDRTEFNYTIIATCSDGHADITMGRMSYLYEEERTKGGYHYKAEEWITDKYGLNKSKTKLARLSGKFRRKTIDRKDEIFTRIKNKLLLD
jgi:colicin import membrane protein